MALVDEIRTLKAQRNATILAHYYETGDIQDIADHIGDSLFLAQRGQAAAEQVVLLAGVVFMGESVKLLSPHKTVLVPDLAAGCSLVDHSPYEKYLAWRKAHPTAIAVTYINSSAAVKAISDVIVTSSNAEKIINAIPADRPILFGPDRNLGRWLSKKSGRAMELWPGSCEVHVLFSERKLLDLKAQHPDALVIAHPECSDGVLKHSDVIGSTSKLLHEVKTRHDIKKFVVATEYGIFHQMQRARPDAVLLQAPAEGSCACNECPYMKLNTLGKIRDALRSMTPQVEVPISLAAAARLSLQRMMDLTEGRAVLWPNEFVAPNW